MRMVKTISVVFLLFEFIRLIIMRTPNDIFPSGYEYRTSSYDFQLDSSLLRLCLPVSVF